MNICHLPKVSYFNGLLAALLQALDVRQDKEGLANVLPLKDPMNFKIFAHGQSPGRWRRIFLS
jgi:hypothetical protein